MWTLLQDLKYGARMFTKSPGFTAVAVMTLALGIGANTVMFSYVNAWVIHPLPYPQPGRLLTVEIENTKTGNVSSTVDAGDFYDFQHESQSFEQLCIWTPVSFNLTGDGSPERIQGARVSWNFFETLGVTPSLGRTFLPQEDQPGAGHVAILSRGLWETRYAGDPRILGRNIQVGGESYTIVGVMPAKFQLPLTGDSNLWTPLALTEPERADRENNWLFAMGRLKPGATMAAAQAELSGIAARLEKEYPKTNTNAGVALRSLESEIGREQGNQEVMALFGVVCLVLLIACANVANLTLARATGRRRELAVRAAMGAGRGRLMRQLLTETLLLFLAGSAIGLALAHWGLTSLASAIPARVRGFLVNYGEVSLDTGTLVYTFVIALVTGMAFGIAPAISATKLDVNTTLKASTGQASDHRSGARLRSALVVAEVALAVVTVICATLVVKAFQGITRVNPGFRPEHVMVAELEVPATKYKEPADIRNLYVRVMERIHKSPQMEAAGASSEVPFGSCCRTAVVYAADKPTPRPGETPWAFYSVVTPGYFRAMEIDLVKGRFIEEADGQTAPPVVVVNQTLADYFWPGENPIGQKLRFEADGDATATVIGLVKDVKLYNTLKDRHDREMYVSFDQFPSRAMGIVVRSYSDPPALAAAIRTAVWSEDADQPLSQVRPLEALLEEQYAGLNIASELMGFFLVLALCLAAIGVYAVMAFNVSRRTHEIGIRLALGAQRGAVLRLVLSSGARLTFLGVVIGLIAAFAASRLLANILFGVSATDPWIYLACTLLLCAVALGASYLPARRAMRVDPIVALRYE